MGIHEDTIQGLQEALAYVKGDRSKARECIIEVSDDDVILKYNQSSETLYLQSIPSMKESIMEGKTTPISECLDSVGWDIT